MLPVTAVILTYNEQKNLPHTLAALAGRVEEIYIVDSFSTDSTLEIAGHYGVNILQHAFETHSKQWGFALKNIPFKTEWILGLDADQEITVGFYEGLRAAFQAHPEINGFYVKRKMFFLGRWISHGGYYPLYLLKVFRADKVCIDEGELMEHHFYVEGETMRLPIDLLENNRNEDIDFWLRKHIRYANLQSREELSQSVLNRNKGNLFGNQNERKLFLKHKVWQRLPLFVRPMFYFIYRYIFLLGFLDGREGLIFHYLQAFWYRFYVDAKIFELKSGAKNV